MQDVGVLAWVFNWFAPPKPAPAEDTSAEDPTVPVEAAEAPSVGEDPAAVAAIADVEEALELLREATAVLMESRRPQDTTEWLED